MEAYPTADAMLSLLGTLQCGFAVDERHGRIDQLTHGLQTATRAERAGAEPALVVAALCHDVGKVFSVDHHAVISAELLAGRVAPEIEAVVRHHQDFTARYAGQDWRRYRHRLRSWYPLAERFADEWDEPAFDPDFRALPLEHFEPAVRAVLGRAPRPYQASWHHALAVRLLAMRWGATD